MKHFSTVLSNSPRIIATSLTSMSSKMAFRDPSLNPVHDNQQFIIANAIYPLSLLYPKESVLYPEGHVLRAALIPKPA